MDDFVKNKIRIAQLKPANVEANSSRLRAQWANIEFRKVMLKLHSVSHTLDRNEKNRVAQLTPDAIVRNRSILNRLWLNPEFIDKMTTCGISKSLEHRGKIQLSQLKNTPKISETMKRLWLNPEFAKLVWKACHTSPNKSERKLLSVIQELELPYKFVGNGQFVLGGKCPDFANTNGQKKVIELFGDYFHSEEVTGHPIEEEIQRRIFHFAQFGFILLIIWESELTDSDLVKSRLVRFEKTNG